MSGAASALLVEDDVAVARTVLRALRAGGWRVTLANSCAQAGEQAGPFACAVIDLDLPDGNGADLAKDLLTRGVVGRVVFHSGSADPTLRQRTRELGPLVVKSEGTSALMLIVGKPAPSPQ